MGTPTVIIQNGKINYNNMKKVHIDINDLLEQARISGHYDISEIVKVQEILTMEPTITTKELRIKMKYPNTRLRQLLGYKDQLSGIGRNTFLKSKEW